MKPSYIIIHHSAVSRKKNPEQFKAIDDFHKSKGWGMIGYHYVIEPDGKIKEGRPVGSVGAHCKQKYMNYRSIGIMLTGNFDEEEPTQAQMDQLVNLVVRLKKEYKISAKRVKPHRLYANYKTCPGIKVTDTMVDQVGMEQSIIIHDNDNVDEWAKTAWEWSKNKKLITKNPRQVLDKQTLAVVLHRFSKLK